MTLAEIMVATLLGTVVLFGISAIDITRFRIEADLRKRFGTGVSAEEQAGLVVLKLTKDLERADRIHLVSANPLAPLDGAPDTVQLRIPMGCQGAAVDPACFDSAANYQWFEYRLNGDAVEYFADTKNGGCGAPVVLATQIAGFDLAFLDRAQPPPGGDGDLNGDGTPDPQDNNVIEYQITWDNAAGQRRAYHGEVTARGVAYSDVNVAAGDSGAGLLLPPPEALPPQC